MTAEADATKDVVQRLRRLAKDTTARTILASLGQLRVHARESGVDETAGDLGLTRGQIVYWFKQLTEVGCGRFIVGRKGNRSRFQWRFDPVSVSSAALKHQDHLDRLKTEEAGSPDFDELLEDKPGESEEGHPATPPSPDDGGSVNEYAFPLQSGFTVRFSLPVPLRKTDAERLATFIRMLSIE